MKWVTGERPKIVRIAIGDRCSFDAFLTMHGLTDLSLSGRRR